jgi:hypothetical protein
VKSLAVPICDTSRFHLKHTARAGGAARALYSAIRAYEAPLAELSTASCTQALLHQLHIAYLDIAPNAKSHFDKR